jgi:formate-dependent nitrite reductase cytochrome c552 subunit
MLPKGSRGSARAWIVVILGGAGIAGLTVLLLALLTNIFERRQEARQPFVRVVDVTEETMDPRPWGQNWPHQYDSYLRTALPTTTKYGGRGPGASDAGPAEQKLDRDPWLKRIFAGYAFALDYRDRRGHAFALFDLIANTAGAGIGAYVAGAAIGAARDRGDASTTVRALAVDLPLMGLTYLTAPLVWLVALGADDPQRAWVMAPLAA